MTAPRLVALLGLCAAAHAADTRISATNTLKLAWFGDNENGAAGADDHYARVIERLDVQGGAGDLDVLTRVDGVLLYDIAPDDVAQRVDEIEEARLERLLVQYRLGSWRLDAGDHHVQLGRGLLLSLKPVDAAGYDIALRGGRIRYDGGVQTAAVFVGRANPVNIDLVNHTFVNDTDDLIAGGRYGLRLEELPEFGLMGVMLRPAEKTLGIQNHTYGGGVYVDAPALADWLAVYTEVDFQQRKVATETDTGLGAYLTADITLGDTVLLVEGLYLDRFEFLGSENPALQKRTEYSRPPTLERFDQEVLQYFHARGGRLRVEQPLGDPETVLHVNGMYRNQQFGETLPLTGESLEQHHVHGYAGVETHVPGRLSVSGGYRVERDADFDPFKEMIHGELDYYQPLTGPHQLHLGGEYQHRGQSNEAGSDLDYHQRATVVLGYEWGAALGLSADLGLDNQDPSARNYFAAGIVDVKPADWFSARVIGGTQRGGIRCLGGVCRDFPAFSGARAELVGRF